MNGKEVVTTLSFPEPQVALRLLGLAGGRLTDTNGDALQHEQHEQLKQPDPVEDGPSDDE